ncbi:MAG: hypothetical protein GY926_25560 [bacterium]|nr:hypothetical protein [bacterium]MCP4968585.1 hypothetical protein [bacterium]
MRRPPYLRWLVAGAVLLTGLAFESRGASTVLYPFADTPIPAGATAEGTIVWREIPSQMLPEWTGDVAGIVRTDIAANDPILPSQIGELLAPSDWWAVALPLPAPVTAGTHIRVVLADNTVVEGIALEGANDTGFELVGTVAFAASHAPLVAQAASNDALVVMIAADTPVATPDG